MSWTGSDAQDKPKSSLDILGSLALVVEQLCPLVIHKILDNSICLDSNYAVGGAATAERSKRWGSENKIFISPSPPSNFPFILRGFVFVDRFALMKS